MFRTGSLLSVLALVAAAPLGAQAVASTSSFRIGALAGLNSATISGSDVEKADRRNGFVGGVYFMSHMVGPLWSRTELLYAQKGAKLAVNDPEFEGTGSLKLAYLELPVLLQLETTTASGLRPHAYVGPSFGTKVSCSVEATVSGTTISSNCDNAEPSIKSFEAAGIIGAGLAFPVGGLSATVGARYQHGFTDIVSNTNAKNRVIGVYGSLEWGNR